MHRDNLKNSLETRWDIALLVIGLFLYAGLLGRTIYLNYEPRLWSDLWLRAAWTLDGGSWALQIFFVWMMFNACFFFLSSVIVFCIRAKSLAAPDTSHLKLALIVTFLVIAALTGWFLLQVAFDSETGEFESPNIGPGLVATGAIYVASLLGLRGMLPAIFAVFGTD